MTKKVLLILLSIWWGWTVIIDFAVVPTVFSVINDFFNAGELGIALFSKLNNFELVISALLIVLSLKQGKLRLGLMICAWMIVMFYFSYLTPKLTHLTLLWKEADAAGLTGIAGIADVQQEHQFFHRVYVGLDSLKLLLLSFALVLNAKT